MLGAVETGYEEEALEGLFLDDALEFAPAEEEVLGCVLGLVAAFDLGEVLQHLNI